MNNKKTIRRLLKEHRDLKLFLFRRITIDTLEQIFTESLDGYTKYIGKLIPTLDSFITHVVYGMLRSMARKVDFSLDEDELNELLGFLKNIFEDRIKERWYDVTE